jgi:hypothetical protein
MHVVPWSLVSVTSVSDMVSACVLSPPGGPESAGYPACAVVWLCVHGASVAGER